MSVGRDCILLLGDESTTDSAVCYEIVTTGFRTGGRLIILPLCTPRRMSDRSDRHIFGLDRESGIFEGSRSVSLVACFRTGGRLCHLTGRAHGLLLCMGRIVPAGPCGSDLAIVGRPGIGRCAPVVSQRVGVAVRIAVAAAGAGMSGIAACRAGGSGHGIGIIMSQCRNSPLCPAQLRPADRAAIWRAIRHRQFRIRRHR